MRTITPVVRIASASLLMALVMWACVRVPCLEDEHEDEDDQEERSDSDADTHGCLLSWSMVGVLRGVRGVRVHAGWVGWRCCPHPRTRPARLGCVGRGIVASPERCRLGPAGSAAHS